MHDTKEPLPLSLAPADVTTQWAALLGWDGGDLDAAFSGASNLSRCPAVLVISCLAHALNPTIWQVRS